MKKLILGLLSALALLPGGMLRSGDVRAAETFAVQSPRRDHRANPHANCHGERYEDRRGRYTKDSWSVYYRGRKVEGASASSFADLGGGYGKDNWTVFYEGRKLEGASAMSFEYKGRGYGKDNWNTYFRGTITTAEITTHTRSALTVLAFVRRSLRLSIWRSRAITERGYTT